MMTYAIIVWISAFISVTSHLAMSLYLRHEGVYSYWSFDFHGTVYKHFYQYRDHTKKYKGKIGFWYYVALISDPIFFILILIPFAIKLISAHWAIIFAVSLGFITVVPLLIYALYLMSKEKYF